MTEQPQVSDFTGPDGTIDVRGFARDALEYVRTAASNHPLTKLIGAAIGTEFSGPSDEAVAAALSSLDSILLALAEPITDSAVAVRLARYVVESAGMIDALMHHVGRSDPRYGGGIVGHA